MIKSEFQVEIMDGFWYLHLVLRIVLKNRVAECFLLAENLFFRLHLGQPLAHECWD